MSLSDNRAIRRGTHPISDSTRSRGHELANALLMAALHEPDEPGAAATVINQILIEGSDDVDLVASVLITLANCGMMFFSSLNALARGEMPAEVAGTLGSYDDRTILRHLLAAGDP